MPNKRNFKIPENVLKSLEEKITSKIMNKLDIIVAEKCKALMGENCKEIKDESALPFEIQSLKDDWLFLHNEIEKLHQKTDHLIGSMSFLSKEYDDFLAEKHDNKNLMNDINGLKSSVKSMSDQQTMMKEELDALEQYGRRENLELHGIPIRENENTNQIVRKVANLLDVEIKESDISTSHRLPNQHQQNFMKQNSGSQAYKTSSIIVRFANRDKRNELYYKRHKFDCSSFSEVFPRLVPENFRITENLTKFRKYLLNEARKAQATLNFKFLWTWNGQIMLRKSESSKVIKILSERDLATLFKFQNAGKHTSSR